MMHESLPARLRVLRAREGLHLTEAAKKIGIGRDTLSDLERGARRPAYPTLRKIAAGYGVPVEELLEDQEPALAGKAKAPDRGPAPLPPPFTTLYAPWLEFIDRYVDRWEAKIRQDPPAIKAGEVAEFAATLHDFGAILSRLGLQEKQERPKDEIGTYGPVIGQALGRIMDLLNPLIAASVQQAEDSDIERLRRRRQEFAATDTSEVGR